MVAVLSILLAGCGGSEGGDSDSAVTMGFDLEMPGSSGIAFDPVGVDGAYKMLQLAVYDTLLHTNPDGSFSPGLAESVEIIDTKTLEVVLRPDLTFADGAVLDAEALASGLMRNVASESAAFRTEFFTIESVEPIDAVTARIHLSAETAGSVYALMASPEVYLVSPDAVEAKTDLKTRPVGAGPFLVESLEPGVIVRLRKNPDYYAADEIKVEGVDIKHIANASPAEVNGVLGKDIDLQWVKDPAQVAAFRGNDQVDVSLRTDTTYLQILMCKKDSPLEDVRVRRALSTATDRDALNAAVLDGAGAAAWGLWPEDHIFGNAKFTDAYAYDPERAKDLLAEAGYAEGFAIDIFSSAGASQSVAELLQAQWAAVGVQLNLVPTTDVVNDFYVNAKAPMLVAPFGGTSRFFQFYVPGSLSNVCEYDDPELNAIVEDLNRADPKSDESVMLWEQFQDLVVGDVLSISLIWVPTLHVWNKDSVEVEFVDSAFGVTQLDWWSLDVPK